MRLGGVLTLISSLSAKMKEDAQRRLPIILKARFLLSSQMRRRMPVYMSVSLVSAFRGMFLPPRVTFAPRVALGETETPQIPGNMGGNLIHGVRTQDGQHRSPHFVNFGSTAKTVFNE